MRFKVRAANVSEFSPLTFTGSAIAVYGYAGEGYGPYTATLDGVQSAWNASGPYGSQESLLVHILPSGDTV
jgi:hypothetical protein